MFGLFWLCIYIAFFILIYCLLYVPIGGRQTRLRDRLATQLGGIALTLRHARQAITASQTSEVVKIAALKEIDRLEQTLPELKRQWLMANTADDLQTLKNMLKQTAREADRIAAPFFPSGA